MSIKKKLGLGIASMALGAALVGGGTFAYFNDTESSTGNTFAAGTIELKPDIPANFQWNLRDQKPGQGFNMSPVTLRNTGTLDGDLSIAFTVTDTDAGLYPASSGTNVLSEVMKVSKFNVGGTSYDTSSMVGSDGILTLDELNGANLDLGTLTAGGTKSIEIDLEFPDTNNAQNQYQGDSLDVDFTLELKQQ